MSFADEVRAELTEALPKVQHCRLAQLCGLLRFAGAFHLRAGGEVSVDCDLASAATARRTIALLRGLGASCEVRTYNERRFGRRARFVVAVGTDARSLQLLHEAGVLSASLAPGSEVPRRVLARSCCRRAFMRGAFLAAGSLSGPRSEAHLEVRTTRAEAARELASVALQEGFELGVHEGPRYVIAYSKRAEVVRGMLAAMGAHSSELRLEEEDVMRWARERANRLTNADGANLRRQAAAADRQRRAIEALGGPDALPRELRLVAELRLAHPEATLAEIAAELAPGVSRDAVAGRLRRIVERAEIA